MHHPGVPLIDHETLRVNLHFLHLPPPLTLAMYLVPISLQTTHCPRVMNKPWACMVVSYSTMIYRRNKMFTFCFPFTLGYLVSPFPPGMMMAGPAFLPGAQLHNPVAARGTDSMRDLAQSSSLSAERARAGSEDSRETESRTETRGFHLKDDVGATPRINPPSSSPPSENSKEKSGGWRRDTSSLPETQSLTANLAFRRVDMSGPSQFPPGFPGFMYPVGQGTFRPPYDHSFSK